MSEKWHTVGKKDRKGKKEPGQHGDHSKSSSRCKPVESLFQSLHVYIALWAPYCTLRTHSNNVYSKKSDHLVRNDLFILLELGLYVVNRFCI